MPKRNEQTLHGKGGLNGKKSTNIWLKNFRKWSNESMLEGIEAVRSGTMGTNRAARSYGVPASTLIDRLSDKVKHRTNSGPAPYLTSEEEELATFLVQLAEMGVGKTKREVLVIVQSVLEKKGWSTDSFNGEGWWIRFMQRHPGLSLQTADPLTSQSKCSNKREYEEILWPAGEDVERQRSTEQAVAYLQHG
jgi:hypothetical protein